VVDQNELQKTLGVPFQRQELLTQALTHSSYANENPGIAPASNERLEFLGTRFWVLLSRRTFFATFRR